MERILDVGCGRAKYPGAIGLDVNPLTDADVIADLNRFPWPFPDSTFDRVLCHHIVEHVTDLVRFMEEIHRIARPGALVEIARLTFPTVIVLLIRPTSVTWDGAPLSTSRVEGRSPSLISASDCWKLNTPSLDFIPPLSFGFALVAYILVVLSVGWASNGWPTVSPISTNSTSPLFSRPGTFTSHWR